MKSLYKAANEARENAYAPYSKFKVGAAVKCSSGDIYSGCNVENASYGLTICAERAAIFSAVADGHTDIKEVLIASGSGEFLPPCGACRQVMQEFGVEKVHLSGRDGAVESYTLKELLPLAFSDEDI